MLTWSLSSWRAWIEMKLLTYVWSPTCRSPHGERGLKYDVGDRMDGREGSLSSWRAWIEMRCRCDGIRHPTSRSPHGERGLKSHNVVESVVGRVALLMESVD